MSLAIYGNTSIASILLSLCHHFADFQQLLAIKTFFSYFGVGFSWGGIAYLLKATLVLPIINLDKSILGEEL